ncbi:MAG: SDR family NAD(P)-dependent oxidoreductase [Xanthobacteraceae bacterium]
MSRKSAELDAVFQTVREKYGRIDVLYANAGIAKLGSVAETTEEAGCPASKTCVCGRCNSTKLPLARILFSF